jgi:hypothetical protein
MKRKAMRLPKPFENACDMDTTPHAEVTQQIYHDGRTLVMMRLDGNCVMTSTILALAAYSLCKQLHDEAYIQHRRSSSTYYTARS